MAAGLEMVGIFSPHPRTGSASCGTWRMARVFARSDSRHRSTSPSYTHLTSTASLLHTIMTPQRLILLYLVSSLWPRSSKTSLSLSMSLPENLSSAFSPQHPSVLNPQMVKNSIPQLPQSKQRRMRSTRPVSLFSRRLETTSSEGLQKDGSISSRQKLARRSTPCGFATVS